MTDNKKPSADQNSTGQEPGRIVSEHTLQPGDKPPGDTTHEWKNMTPDELIEYSKEHPEAWESFSQSLADTMEPALKAAAQAAAGVEHVKEVIDNTREAFFDLSGIIKNIIQVFFNLPEWADPEAIDGVYKELEELEPFLNEEINKHPQYAGKTFFDLLDQLDFKDVFFFIAPADIIENNPPNVDPDRLVFINDLLAIRDAARAAKQERGQGLIGENSVLHNKYFPMHHNQITDLLKLWFGDITQRDEKSGNIVITNAEANAALMVRGAKKNSRPSVNTHKLLGVALSEFTEANHFSRSTKERKLTREIAIPLNEYARECKYKIDPLPTANEEEEAIEKKRCQGRRKEARKQIAKDLNMLGGVFVQYRVRDKKKNADSLTQLNLIEWTNISDNYIRIKFTETAAAILARSPLMQYPRVLLGISARNPNAYSIGYKFAMHYNNDNNIARGTNTRLKVSTLLEQTTLPTYNYLIETGNGRHWEDRIKEPFEKALDALTGVYISEWEYVKAKGVKLTDQEAAAITSYEVFSNLYVEFTPIDAPEHQEERRQRRAAEKEEALKNKENKTKSKRTTKEKPTK